MCGIFGMLSRKEKPFNKRAFCTMGVRNDSRGGDSCGIFIDGLVEYGVDKQKEFINFFRDSIILDTVTDCKVALGHCRKASVGKVSLETAQPVILYNENNEIDYVLIHNGTIHNYKELAEQYIPDIDIEGLTDSQVMARIFYHKGYDCLSEYYGGAVFVIHDYRIDRSLVFKGKSRKNNYVKESEEERPLYYCWHNGRFVFSSIFETLYAFYYEEDIYSLPSNKLITIRSNKLKTVKEYSRDEVSQTKPYTQVKTPCYSESNSCLGFAGYYANQEHYSYSIKFNGTDYLDENKEPMHGVYIISTYGYVFPNKKTKENWYHEVGFFHGKMLKHPKAFSLLTREFNKAKKKYTKEFALLLSMLDFNPFNDGDDLQYYWFDGDQIMIPQGPWKWPMVNFSCTFDESGIMTAMGQEPYYGWTTDYNMYTYDEGKIIKDWKKLCVEE